MAQDWYLMNSAHDTVSGFESEDFENMAIDSFEEALQSGIGTNVDLYTSNLQSHTTIRAVIQGSIQDTKLNSMQRKMLTTIGTASAGMYVKYKNRYWLIIGLVDDNGVYEKSILILCNHLLTWKNRQGNIVQRWINAASASQYNNGESSTGAYYISRTDQLMILMPDDDECLLLNHNQRFVIDKRCKVYEREFLNSVTKDTSKPLLTYKLTRADNVLYDYQDSGHSEFIAYQDDKQENDGYYVIDGVGYWLCDNGDIDTFESTNETPILSSSIEYDSPQIICEIEPAVFTAKFFDENGEEVADVVPTWSVNCEFADQLDIDYVDNSIIISCANKRLINKSFELSLSGDGYITTTITATIVAFI